MTIDARAKQLYGWFCHLPDYQQHWQYQPIFADASFRRYFRLTNNKGDTRVLLDSPPEKEPLAPFLSVALDWKRHGIYVPNVLAFHIYKGFALLEDMGDIHLESVKKAKPKRLLYQNAIDQILKIQTLPHNRLPVFDQSFILHELSLLREWTLPLLPTQLSAKQHSNLDRLFSYLCQQLLGQQSGVIHRDYHCRNLMVIDDRLGVIDFQGAMVGPYTYDIVSLLTDTYRDFTQQEVIGLQKFFLSRNFFTTHKAEVFLHDFACVQLQRHIKILGIFCRLWKRDGKQQYLQYLPRVCHHILTAGKTIITREKHLLEAMALLEHICTDVQKSL